MPKVTRVVTLVTKDLHGHFSRHLLAEALEYYLYELTHVMGAVFSFYHIGYRMGELINVGVFGNHPDKFVC